MRSAGADLAMISERKHARTSGLARDGGIDLNTSGMKTTLRKEGAGVQMAFDAAMLARIRKDGVQSLTPVIDTVTPIRNIWPAFGMQAPQSQEQLAGV